MRIVGASLGFLAVAAYAVLGALTVDVWAVEAGSGAPLGEARAAMQRAGQTYGIWPGVVFAVAGLLLGAAWAAVGVRNRTIPAWVLLAGWCGIVMLGSPAFFAAGFSNLMSVGDTFFGWHPDAAWAVERPFHLASAAAALLLLGTLIAVAVRAVRRHEPRGR